MVDYDSTFLKKIVATNLLSLRWNLFYTKVRFFLIDCFVSQWIFYTFCTVGSLFKLQNTKHIEKYLKVYIHVTGADRNTWQAFIEFYRNDAHRSLPLIAKNSMSSLRRLSPNNIKGTCWSYFFGSCSVFIISDTKRSY